jgi:opacity protein-like surface antigen
MRRIITFAIGALALAALAAPATAQTYDQQQQPRAQLEPIVIMFTTGSTELDPRGQQRLEETALMVAEDERQQMFIALVVAEDDPLGPERTAAARRYLEGAGIAPDRIRAVTPDEAMTMTAMEPVLVQLTGPETGPAGMQQPQTRGMQQQDPSLGEEWEEAGEATGEAFEETGEAVVATGEAVGEAVVDTTARPGMGLDVSVGGGFYDFLDSDTNDYLSLGGMWEARVGWRMGNLGVEAAYIGSYNDIDALGLDNDARLIGTGVEAAGRFDILPESVVVPYVLAGLGITHYDLSNASFNTSNVGNTDNVFYIPLAAGAMYDITGQIFLDARFTVRPAFDSDLIDEANEDTGMDSWSLAGRAGFRF